MFIDLAHASGVGVGAPDASTAPAPVVGVNDDSLARELRPLTLGAVLRAQRRGAEVLATRSAEAFADGHLVGCTHIALDAGFARLAETLLSPDRPIVLITAPGREHEAAARLSGVGLERVHGFLAGGIEAVRHLVALVKHPGRMSSAVLRWRLTRGPLTMIDVRAAWEWRRKAMPGSVNIPLPELRKRLDDIPAGPVVIMCRTGEQSSTAASLLEQIGRMNVVCLAGGLAAWQALDQTEWTGPARLSSPAA